MKVNSTVYYLLDTAHSKSVLLSHMWW